jgi:hypothetical protein
MIQDMMFAHLIINKKKEEDKQPLGEFGLPLLRHFSFPNRWLASQRPLVKALWLLSK